MEDFKKRIEELSRRAAERAMYTETRFLTIAQQTLIEQMPLPVKATLWGGFSSAERKVCVFGNEEDLGYPPQASVAILEIAPKSMKYADPLTHRDFLGAILSQGLSRDVVGDILVFDRVGYAVVCRSAVPSVETLTSVRHTAVTVRQVEALPETAEDRFDHCECVAASERLDAVLAAVFSLSRNEAKKIVVQERVSVNGVIRSNPDASLKEGDRISVRGCGRFYFDGFVRLTRSGKSRFRIRLMK